MNLGHRIVNTSDFNNACIVCICVMIIIVH